MRCPGCSTDNDEALKFCIRCGADLGTTCPQCGAPSRSTAIFCGQCASPLRPEGRTNVPPPAAEHRQITVLFCDLVNSTGLSQRLDAEDWREILREYHARCAAVVREFDGHIAQYLGDGLLIYFGYPRAHEDEPRRAVRAALSIVQAVTGLSPRLEASHGVKLQVRIGIHTGAVVVGEIGAAERHEFLAIGETPNLTASIQGVAEPNSVVISDATYRLTKGYFTFRPLEARSLKGFSHVTTLYEVTGDARVRHQLDVATAGELTPFIGRAKELAFVVDRWRDAQSGQAPVVTLCGEPGIGKSRLVRTLREKVSSEQGIVLECYGSPIFQGTALHPVLEMIEGQLGFTRETSPHDKLGRLRAAMEHLHVQAPETVALLAALLSIPADDSVPPVALSPQKQRQASFDALAASLHALTTQQPVLFVFEDLHWADPSTMEFLGLLIERPPPGPLMLLQTHRPEFVPPWKSARIAPLSLYRMPPVETRQLLRAVLRDTSLPEAVEEEVLTKAEGVPLYLEEIAKATLESPTQRPAERSLDLAPSSTPMPIPATVRDSLTARLDRLGSGKTVVQIGAVLGRTFSLELLQAASGIDEAVLRDELDRLVTSELLCRGTPPADDTYSFKHALIQDAAYASLLRVTRQAYHRQIALALSERFPEIADAQPEVLAHHYTEALMAPEAVGKWALVGQRALARSAYLEAIDAFGRALRLLATISESNERDRSEIELRCALGSALVLTLGYAAQEVEENYARASFLCEKVGDSPLAGLYGIWAVHLVRSDLGATARFAELFEGLAVTSADPLTPILAYGSLGVRAFYLANYGQAQELFVNALGCPNERNGQSSTQGIEQQQLDALVKRLQSIEAYLYPIVYSAWSSIIQGLVGQAHESLHRALDLAESTRNPYALALVLAFVAVVARDSNDVDRLREVCARVIALSLENGFPFWLSTANALLGWAEVKSGNVDAGLKQAEMGVATIHNIGCFVVYPYYKSCLAEALLLAGRPAEALAAIDEALSFSEGKLASNYVPVMLRLKADILATRGDLDEAERNYRLSLSTLREQGAKLFELQTSIGLARLLRRTHRVDEARAVLGPISGSFGDGAPLLDVDAARALLVELS